MDESEEDKRLMKIGINGLVWMQNKYITMKDEEKREKLTIIVNKHRNEPLMIRMLTYLKKNTLNYEFGKDMLTDAAFMMFPDTAAA